MPRSSPKPFVFDNIQALVAGDMRDEVVWAPLMPWLHSLTRKEIGQVWLHHTGHTTDHGYGTKTREWQMDTVALMEVVEQPDADVSFILKFTKARERMPENRSDFDPVNIALVDDKWTSDRAPPKPKKVKETCSPQKTCSSSRPWSTPSPHGASPWKR